MSLPHGWIQQHDANYNHPFWVDTRSSPPRATWVHPHEDAQFLAEHPYAGARDDPGEPPPYDAAEAEDKDRPSSADSPDAGPSTQREHRRGVLGRLKDRAIGTREEREAHRQLRAEQAARAEEQARQARMRQLEEREAYMRAHGGYAPYRRSYPGYGRAPAAQGLGGDNTAALLLGGLAGGLLLGDVLGGGLLF